ncbi:hypothetical protein KMW28_11710 [Flammeovirga yaeyamensis]|uniref:Lipoprotein n=1 Tax=Flammeovirga yaeyamensis TaxID=367791 RepID=A0AAX1N3D3_9BACT|nr:hypothetical protein [Flammeovirga yaeyamensis]MBB3696172.1 multidrug efflux pump subunit AcrA (membrane-fusion protein) [Flammeovirga yaeyamensis]NMF34855.1 hypothetical protein [Flammeovirga yaeyamensis]QWG00318.1 hypothetical protein KMW28_11710 [Flammeovirga yaeyamensis]
MNKTSIFTALFMAMIMAVSFTGCKSQKKLAAEQAAKELLAKTQKAQQDLEAMVGKDYASLDELATDEARLNEIKSYNLEDATVNDLISKADSHLASQRATLEAKLAAEQKAKEEAEKAKAQEAQKRDIYYLMDNIQGSGDTQSANLMITEALALFASPDVPVLIEIYNDGDIVDYDKPTTASKYLNKLKDVQRNPDKIKEFKTDANGKITELILTKK